MAGLGDLVAVLTTNTGPWVSGLGAASSALSGFASRTAGTLSGMVAHWGLVANGINAIKQGLGALTMPLTLAANAESTAISFTTMLKSADMAKTTIAELRKFADVTPFDTPEVIAAGKALMGYQFQARDLVPVLTAVGDVAAGLDIPFGELVTVFGKMKSQGRVMTNDLNEMSGRGIPIISELAKVFKKPESAIRGLAESGQISFGHIAKAFDNMAGKGGQFAGLMDAQSRSTAGLWSTMQSALGNTFEAIGTALIEGFNLKGLLTDSIGFVESFKSTWLPGITSTISAMGATFWETVAFLKGIWDGWIANNLATLMGWVDTYQAYLGQWVTMFTDAYQSLSIIVTEAAAYFGMTWENTFQAFLDNYGFVARNWYTLLQVGVQNVALFATNCWAHIEAFFTNLQRWMAWLPGNWRSVMVTAADLLMTAFINMAKNINSFFKSLYEFAAGKGFKFEATSLTDGFHNSIGQIPDMVSAAVSDSTPELAKLYDKLNQDEAAFAAKQAARAKPAATSDMIPGQFKLAEKSRTLADIAGGAGGAGGAAVTPKKTKEHTDAKTIEAGSAEAFRLFARTQNGPRSKEDKIADNTSQANKLLATVASEAQLQRKALEAKPALKVAKLK